VERVAMTEMGTVTDVRNAAIMVAVVATVVSNGLWLLLVLRLLCALWLLALRLLCALWLLALCLLGALWLRFFCTLLRLRFLCALLRLGFLRTLLRLGFLCALLRLGFLRTLLRLGFLCALLRFGFLRLLRLRLALRRLGFCSASALFLLAFLCKCRNGGSEK